MGYFSSGTEGAGYVEHFCSRCVHGQDPERGEYACAVWLAHNEHNYAECNKKDSILHILIPRSKERPLERAVLDVSGGPVVTADQKAILFRLQRVTMPVASYDKRFRRNMHADLELTEKQAAYLLKLDHRYRRQTGGAHICTDLCATYTRRQVGECFEAPLPPKPPSVTRADRQFLSGIGIAADPHAELPLFDGVPEVRP